MFDRADEKVQFKAAGDLGGIGDTLGAWKEKADAASAVEFTTTTLGDIPARNQAPPVIDFMSRDIEGAELAALKGFPFEKYKVARRNRAQCRRAESQRR